MFNQGKGLVVAAGLLAFLVWFFGFMVVAGEWFAMWQSQTWNGQEPAFRFYVTALAVLIFVCLPDGDLALRAERAQDNKKPAAKKPAAKTCRETCRQEDRRARNDPETPPHRPGPPPHRYHLGVSPGALWPRNRWV